MLKDKTRLQNWKEDIFILLNTEDHMCFCIFYCKNNLATVQLHIHKKKYPSSQMTVAIQCCTMDELY